MTVATITLSEDKKSTGRANGKKISIDQLLEHLCIGRTTLHRLRKSTDFPRPVIIFGRMQRWDIDEIKAWVKNKKLTPSETSL
ncbi:AlpA family phage regulatory protein [Oryzomonas rubra]